MRPAIAIALMLLVTSVAQAHSYRIGNLEIVHPAIMVPQAKSDCTCAHMKIINHGSETEYFLGADIAIARSTILLMPQVMTMISVRHRPCPYRRALRSIYIVTSGACFSVTFIQAWRPTWAFILPA